MPLTWRAMFGRENDLVKAGVAAKIEANADQHAVIEVTLRQLQDDHDKLEQTCKVVIGEYNSAKARLETDLTLQQQLNTRGMAAHQAGHVEAATAIAKQLVSVTSRIESEKRTFEHAQVVADKAKAAFRRNGEELQAKMAEAKELHALVDEAAVDHNMNEAMKSINSMSAHSTPSFDSVRSRVQSSVNAEEADTELHAMDEATMGVSDDSAVSTGAADELMAGWGSPALPSGSRRELAPAKSKSGTDRLYE